MDSTSGNNKRGGRRTWSKFEEDALLTVLKDIIVKYGNRTDVGFFKSVRLKKIENELAKLTPNYQLTAHPHIENKIRKLKKDYGMVFDMLGKSGFGWSDTKKCVEIDSDEAWLNYVQSHKDAEGWRNKSFPIYERLVSIFGQDRASGKEAETPADIVERMEREANTVEAPFNGDKYHLMLCC